MCIRRSIPLFVILLGIMLASNALQAQSPDTETHDRLAVLWTSGDPDVAHKVCLMYTHVAKTAGWFDEILLIVWGPSQKLLAADKDVRAKVDQMKADGIQVQVCVYCAETYGLTEHLRGLGFEVKPMGVPLTEVLKDDGWKLLTF
jgi:hypothetical protein